MSMRTTVPGIKPTSATVPEGNNDATTTVANINQTEQAREVTATRELGIPPAQAAELPKVQTTAPSIATTLLEKKREYESMRQRAIDELLNTIGSARQQFEQTEQAAKEQLTELGWEDPDEQPVRRPGRPRGSTNAPRPVGRPPQRAIHSAERKTIPALKNKKCPVCGERGHDARSHRKENLAAIAKGLRKAKR